jgi:hypothetical protein
MTTQGEPITFLPEGVPEVSIPYTNPPIGSLWRHEKTGGTYVVLGFAMIEATWKIGVVYLPVDGHAALPIVRDHAEFMDGRFTSIRAVSFIRNLP